MISTTRTAEQQKGDRGGWPPLRLKITRTTTMASVVRVDEVVDKSASTPGTRGAENGEEGGKGTPPMAAGDRVVEVVDESERVELYLLNTFINTGMLSL